MQDCYVTGALHSLKLAGSLILKPRSLKAIILSQHGLARDAGARQS